MSGEKKRKKSLVGWAYSNDKLEWENISAWGYIPGVNIVVLKYKKDLGNQGRKIKVTVEEIS